MRQVVNIVKNIKNLTKLDYYTIKSIEHAYCGAIKYDYSIKKFVWVK